MKRIVVGENAGVAAINRRDTVSAQAEKMLEYVGRGLIASRFEELFKPFENHPLRVAPFRNFSVDQVKVSANGDDGWTVTARPMVGDVWNHANWKPLPDAQISIDHKYESLDQLLDQLAKAIRNEIGWSKIEGSGVRRTIGQALALAVSDELKDRYREATGAVAEKGTSIGLIGVDTKSTGANGLQVEIEVGVRDHRGIMPAMELQGAKKLTYVMDVHFENLSDVAELARFVDGHGLVEGGLTSSKIADIVDLVRSIARGAKLEARALGGAVEVDLPDVAAQQLTNAGAPDAKSFGKSTGVGNPQLLGHAKLDPGAAAALAGARKAFEADVKSAGWLENVTAALAETQRRAGDGQLARFLHEVQHFYGREVGFMQPMLGAILDAAEALAKPNAAAKKALAGMLAKVGPNQHAAVALTVATAALIGFKHPFADALETQVSSLHRRFLQGGLYPDSSGIAAAISRIALAIGDDAKLETRDVIDAAKKELAREGGYGREDVPARAAFAAIEALAQRAPASPLAKLVEDLKRFRQDENAVYSKHLAEPLLEAARILAKPAEAAKRALIEKLQHRQGDHEGLVYAFAARTLTGENAALNQKLADLPRWGGLKSDPINAAAAAALAALQ